jgi:hypothetical protein
MLSLIPDGHKRSQAVREIAQGWIGRDPDAALEWLSTLDNVADSMQAIQGITSSTRHLDAHTATRLIQGIQSDQLRAETIQRTAHTLASGNLEGAFALIDELPEGKLRNAAVQSLIRQWANHDPAAAAGYAGELSPEAGGDTRMFESIAGQWAGHDVDAAVAWAETLAPASHPQVFRAIMQQWARSAPEEAGAYAVVKLEGKAQEDAAYAVARLWANSDPAGAAAWIADFPDGKLRNLAVQSVVSTWSARDLPSTGEWIGSLPAGTSRDLAITTYVNKARNINPANATHWATRIDDASKRWNSLSNAYKDWQKFDPDGAQSWLDISTLSAEEKEKLGGGTSH